MTIVEKLGAALGNKFKARNPAARQRYSATVQRLIGTMNREAERKRKAAARLPVTGRAGRAV